MVVCMKITFSASWLIIWTTVCLFLSATGSPLWANKQYRWLCKWGLLVFYQLRVYELQQIVFNSNSIWHRIVLHNIALGGGYSVSWGMFSWTFRALQKLTTSRLLRLLFELLKTSYNKTLVNYGMVSKDEMVSWEENLLVMIHKMSQEKKFHSCIRSCGGVGALRTFIYKSSDKAQLQVRLTSL